MTGTDQGFTRQWYGRLPDAFRDLDALDQDLWGFCRLYGDLAGGIGLVVDVLEGAASIRPVVLADGTVVVLAGGVLDVDGVIDPVTGGVLVLVDAPVTVVDAGPPVALVVTSGDWLLTDPLSLPPEWVPWVAQMLGVDLTLVPVAAWREWLADPVSRSVGSLASLLALTAFHTDGVVSPVVTRPGFWEVTVTVPSAGITTSAGQLQAALTAAEPAGVKVLLATT